MKKKELTHGGLFSGIGGFTLGAQMSGIKTIWECENNPLKKSLGKKLSKHHYLR